MGILEDILKQLTIIAENTGGGTTAPADKEEAPKRGRPAGSGSKTPPKKTEAKGPSLEDVQDLVRELVSADADNKVLVKKAIKAVDKTAERVGDFEDDADKLAALHKKLVALKGDADEPAADDDDDDML